MWVLTLLRRLWAGPQSDRCMSDGTVSGPTAPCVARSVAAVAASVGRAFVSGLSILRPSARLLRAKRCIGGLVDRFGALRAPLAAALFVLSLLISLASAAQAQTATTLVSNTGQSAVQSTNLEFATPFTTGSTAASYTISQVNIRLGPNSDRTLSVAIRENGNNNRPGALVAKLTNPTTRTNNALNTFTAPAGTQLLANTTYWLVFNDGRANNRTQNPTVGITEADGQTGATGWSIANGSRINGQGSTGFPDRNDASMIFQINGQADTTAVYQIRSSPVNIVEGGPDNRCSFRRDSGTALVASLNYEITETGDMLNPARKGKFSRELSQSQQSLSHVTNHRLQTVDDNIDEPRSTVTCKLLPGTGYTIGSTGQQSFVVEDNEPTTVSLVRTGSGAIEEGETAEFTVRLSRALVAGEVIDVPLAMTNGRNVTPDEWSLALKSGQTLNTGVTLTGESTATPQLRFEGAASETATLVLTSVQDVVSESDETITVALGPDGDVANGFDRGSLGTNVGGGADPTSTAFTLFLVVVTDDDAAPTGVELSVGPGAVAEDGGATEIEVTAALSGSTTFGEAKTVTVAVGAASDSATEGTDYATVADQTITIGAGERSGTVTFTLTPTDDSTSEGVEALTLTPAVADVAETFGLTPATITITDDGALPVTLVLDPASIDESGDANSAMVTAVLSGAVSEQDIVLTVAAAPGTNTVAADYTLAGTTLTIPAGQRSSMGTVTLTAVDNAVDAANKAVTVSATVSGGNGVAAPEDVALTIVDDEPTIASLARVGSGRINEGGTTEFTVTLSRALVAGEVIEVPLSAGGGMDVTTDDWSLALKPGDSLNTGVTLTGGSTDTPQVTFSGAGSRTATLVLTAVQDVVLESSGIAEVLFVRLGPDGTGANGFDRTSLNTNVGGGADRSSTARSFFVFVTDDDAAPTGVELSVDPGTVAEDGSATAIEVTAALSGGTTFPEAKTVTVAVGAASDSATEGTDYATVDDQTITIGAGESSGTVTFTLTPTDDSTSEGVEVITLTPTVADVAETFRLTPASITITDDGALPVTLVLSPASIDESGARTRATVTAVLSGAVSNEDIVLMVAAAPGTNTVAADYALAGTTLTIPAGQRSSTGTVTITAVGNAVDAANKAVTVSATVSGGNGVAAPADVTLTIVDDEPTIASLARVGSDRINEGGTTEFTVTLGRALVAGEVIDVPLSIGGGTGVTREELSLALKSGDSLNTGVTLTGASTDRPQVTFSGAGSRTATLVLTAVQDVVSESSGIAEVLLVRLGPDGTGANGFDRTSLNTNVGGGANPSSTARSFQVQVTDDDAPTGVELSVDTDTVAEDGSATEIEVTATLTGLTTFGEAKTVTVAVGAASDSATEGTDYATVDDQTITIGAGESSGTVTFTLTPTDDSTSEGDEAIGLTPTVAGVPDWFVRTGTTITLTDDEALPVVTLALDPASIDESGDANSATVTATLTGAVSSEDIVLTVAAAPGADTEAADYTLAGTTLTIPAGQSASTGTVTVTAVDNAVDAVNKAVTVSATVSGGNGVAAPADVTLTITDDDPTIASLARVGSGRINEGGTTEFTVTLSRALVAGEVIDVPLVIVGETVTPVTPADWSLALKSGQNLNTGVTLTGVTPTSAIAATAQVAFSGAGSQTATLVLTAVQDVVSESAEQVVVALGSDGTGSNGFGRASLNTNVGGGAGRSSTANSFLVSITDDDAAPTGVTLSVDPGTVAEDGGATAFAVTATLTGGTTFPEAKTVTVAVGAASDSATEGTDYATVADQTITIAAGESRGTVTFTLTPTDDSTSEGVEGLTLTPAVADVAETFGLTPATITITDDGALPVTLVLSPASIDESGARTRATVTAVLSGAVSNEDIVLTVAAAPGTNTVAADYTLAGTTLTIPAGQRSSTGTVTITAVGNAVDAANKAVTVSATVSGGNGVAAPADVTLTIVDDEPTIVSLARVGSDRINEGGTTEFTVTLGRALVAGEVIDVPIAIGGPNVIPANWSLALKAGQGLNTGVTLTSTGTATPQVAFSGAGSQTATLVLTAVQDVVSEGTREVVVALGPDGTGANGFDRTSLNTNVGGGANPSSTARSFQVQVTDDDAPTGVELSVDTDTVAEDGSATEIEVTATLTGLTTFGEAKTVTVAVGAASDSATEGTDYATVDDQTITIRAGESSGTVTFTLTPTDDSTSEGDEAIGLTPTVAGVPDWFVRTGTTITLTDDEALPVVTLALDPASIDESGDANSATVTATLTGAVSSEDIVLTVAAAPGADTEAADYTLAGTTLTIPAGQSASTGTVTVTAVDNAVDAVNKAVTVSATVSGGNGVAAPADVTLTITDDDPTIASLARVGSGRINEGGTTEFTVTLSRALVAGEVIDVPLVIVGETVTPVTPADWSLALKSGQNLNTGVTLTGVTPTSAIAATAQVAFSGAGSQTATLVLTAVQDVVSESAEQVVVALGSDGTGSNGFGRASLNTNVGGGAGRSSTANSFLVSITDDDAAPTGVTLSVDPGTVAEDGGATAFAVTATLTGGDDLPGGEDGDGCGGRGERQRHRGDGLRDGLRIRRSRLRRVRAAAR